MTRTSQQILFVNTSATWCVDHADFGDRQLLGSLMGLDDVEVHDVSVPLFSDALSADVHALRLLPFASYGDALVGLGHSAAFITHPRSLIVVDHHLISALDTARSGREQDLLLHGFCAADRIYALSASVAAALDGHAGLTTELVASEPALVASLSHAIRRPAHR